MDLGKLKKNKRVRAIIKFILKLFFPLWIIYWLWRFIKGKYKQHIIEVYLISHPCSGRTWLRTILTKLFSLKFNVPFSLDIFGISKSQSVLPNIASSHASAKASKKNSASPKNINIKEDFKKYKNKKIIFLVRDPRDTIISHYFEITKRQRIYHDLYRGDISSFIHDPYFGIEKIINFLNLWIRNKNVFSDFLLIKYEDLHKDVYKEITRLLKFLNLTNIEDDLIKEAINFASFKNMRKMEEADALNTALLRPGDKTDKESYKVRKGKVGGYKEYLSPQDINYLNEQLKKINPYFGYS